MTLYSILRVTFRFDIVGQWGCPTPNRSSLMAVPPRIAPGWSVLSLASSGKLTNPVNNRFDYSAFSMIVLRQTPPTYQPIFHHDLSLPHHEILALRRPYCGTPTTAAAAAGDHASRQQRDATAAPHGAALLLASACSPACLRTPSRCEAVTGKSIVY